MLWLSEMLLQRHDLESFEALKQVVVEQARSGEVFFGMDVKPPFPDTPQDWEDKLEAAFSSAQNS